MADSLFNSTDASTRIVTSSQKDLWLAVRFGGEDACRAFEGRVSWKVPATVSADQVRAQWERMAPKAVEDLPCQWLWEGTEDHLAVDRPLATVEELERGPVFRLQWVKAEVQYLVLTYHLLDCDARSAETLLQRLISALGRVSAQPVSWDRVPPSASKGTNYWLSCLKQGPEALELPLDFPRPPSRGFRSAQIHNVLEPSLIRDLVQAAASVGVRWDLLVQSVVRHFLARLTGQGEYVLAVSSYETPDPSKWALGRKVSILPMVVKIVPGTWAEVTKQLAAEMQEAELHRDFLFAEVLETVSVPRDPSRIPLVPVQWDFQESGADTESRLELLAGSYHPFELTLGLRKIGTDWELVVTFLTDLLNPLTVKSWTTDVLHCLREVAQDLTAETGELRVVSDSTCQQQWATWNQTEVWWHGPTTALGLVTEQMRAHPAAIALEFGAERWTYQDLDERSTFLALRLRSFGVVAGDTVGVCLTRGPEMVAALLAVWKAGAAYVPLDPDYPPQRLDFIVRDAAIAALITESSLKTVLESHELNRLWVDQEVGRAPHDTSLGTTSHELAYILHTSGSTGNPKGVQIEQTNLVNFLNSMKRDLGIDQNTVLVAVTTLSFDIAGLELFLPLTVGARVVLAPREVALDGGRLGRLLDDSGATLFQATPATWRLLVEASWRAIRPVTGLCGGEALPRDLAVELMDRIETLWNVYGPTETTIWSTLERIDTTDVPLSIGRPMANTSLYIVDDKLRPVPTGTVGELLIGGDGVARGYLNRPDLTVDRFLADPFRPGPGRRVYRTGDLCRFGPDGRVYYVRRNDNQVKVRGFRIELGEIETAVGRLPGVKQAVAAVREVSAGDSRIVAYLVLAQGAATDLAEVKAALVAALPAYMVPQHLVVLEQFPLTPNGKIDRKALPLPSESHEPLTQPVGPTTELEAHLLSLWQTVLRRESLGITDNFFQVGGHSLLAARLLGMIRDQWGVELPMRILFEKQTVQDLARSWNPAWPSGPSVAVVASSSRPRDRYRMSAAQERNWFAAKRGPGIAFSLALTGRFDAATIRSCLQAIVDRHRVLCSVFEESSDGVWGVIPSDRRVELRVVAPSNQTAQRLAEFASRGFDLAHGPLFRFELLLGAPGEATLAAAFSQLVFDGASVFQFRHELAAALAESGKNAKPAGPERDYTDYCQWNQARMLQRRESSLAWWRSLLGDEVLGGLIPTDFPRKIEPTYRGKSQSVEVPPGLVDQLRSLAQSAGATLPMVLMAGLFLVLHRLSGRQQAWLATPVAGRQLPSWEPLLGTFAHVLLLRSQEDPHSTFLDFLAQIRDLNLDSFEHQDLPLDALGLRLANPDPTASIPLYQVEFNYETVPAEESVALEAGGVLIGSANGLFGGSTPNELTLVFRDTGHELSLWLEWASDLFRAETLTHWLECYWSLLATVASKPDSALDKLDLFSGQGPVIEGVTSGAQKKRPTWIPSSVKGRALRVTDPHLRAVPLGAWGQLTVEGLAILNGVRLTRDGRWEKFEERTAAPRTAHKLRTRVFDPVEFQVIELFERALGLTGLSLQDNFFDRGGHSAVAVQIMNGVKRHFDVSLALSALFTSPTPYALSKVIRRERGLPDPETGKVEGGRTADQSAAVPIQPLGSLPPIFVAAGVGGNPMNLRFIAKALGPDQPFYGLQHRGTNGTQRPHRSVDAMVEEYLADIRRIQPKGPYVLGGFSAGGIAAFELARAFQAQGDEVSLVVLFDAESPLAQSQHQPIGDKIRSRLKEGGLKVFLHALNHRWQGLWERITVRVGAALALVFRYRFRNEAVQAAWGVSVKSYVPRPLQVPTLLFRANDRHLDETDATNGWGSLLNESLQVIAVEGDHLTHIEPPHIEATAQRLKNELERIRSHGGSPRRVP